MLLLCIFPVFIIIRNHLPSQFIHERPEIDKKTINVIKLFKEHILGNKVLVHTVAHNNYHFGGDFSK